MSATLDDVFARLAALEAQQAQLLRGVALLVRHLGAAPAAGASSGAVVSQIAPDALLDAADGDPPVRFDVKRGWTAEGGESMKGQALSTCPPRFLDLYAGQLEWSAGQPDKVKYRDENLRGAALARGWATRLRREAPPADAAAGEDLT